RSASLLRHPTGSILFPYPTLFRSRRWDDFDCVVDIGRTHDPRRLRFDHKPPAFPDRNQTCAAKLVWEFLLQQGRPLGHLVDLIRSEEHTSELQSRENLVCRLLLEK